MSAPTIERTTFQTSRLLDFVSEKELTLQCGYGREDWPLVAVKELIDNALDACEEQGIAPEITLTVDESTITVADNGTGIPPETVDQLLDFSIRVSSREAYVAPDRGAQGNALKTLVAMPFVLDGEKGRVDIVGGGACNEIAFSVDRIQQRPAADISRSEKTGSLVRIHWPAVASYGDDAKAPFLQDDRVEWGYEGTISGIHRLATDFAFLNPHLTITVDVFGEATTIEPTDAEWAKWRPSSPTSPHWYKPEHLERLIGAYVTNNLQNGTQNGNGKTVREFVSEFKGLTATAKQKAVLAKTGLQREPLYSLVAGRDFDHERVAGLLDAMKAEAKPVRPSKLGTIGRAHLETRFAALGIREGSFDYKRIASAEGDVPQVTEIAFAALEDESDWRRLVTGVNWSAAWVNPFRRLGEQGRSLDTLLSERRFAEDQPIALLLHVAHPNVQYTDRGKSTVLAQ